MTLLVRSFSWFHYCSVCLINAFWTLAIGSYCAGITSVCNINKLPNLLLWRSTLSISWVVSFTWSIGISMSCCKFGILFFLNSNWRRLLQTLRYDKFAMKGYLDRRQAHQPKFQALSPSFPPHPLSSWRFERASLWGEEDHIKRTGGTASLALHVKWSLVSGILGTCAFDDQLPRDIINNINSVEVDAPSLGKRVSGG